MIIREITGCAGCPFCDSLDMAPGYLCKLFTPQEERYIKEDKHAFPITPEWCPLIENNILVKMIK